MRRIVSVVVLGVVSGAGLAQPWLLRAQDPAATTPAFAPMRPRMYDPRVAFYFVQTAGDSTTGGLPVRYIARRRLEKRNPSAAISNVVRPIIYRIDSTVPRQWVPYLKRGVEAWGPVFESIGFRGAIVVRTPTDPYPDTTSRAYIPESHIGWSPSDEENAFNQSEPDTKTGEILRSTIVLFNGVVTLMQRTYFTYAGASDPRARFPFPDSLTGKLLQMVVTHEVGHSLGLEHNFRSGAMYPTDSLRSKSFVRRFGHTPSLMAYSYFNYVASAEDHIDPDDLRARIGVYDRWALAWGYRPVPGAKTPRDELPTLERWRSAQDTVAYLRATVPELANLGIDPADQTDVMGNDAVKTAQYGIRNLARVADLIAAEGDTGRVGPKTLRTEVAERWALELGHVIDVIGGVTPRVPYAANVQSMVRVPMDSAYQIAALRFVVSHLFNGEDDLVRRHVLKIFDPSTASHDSARAFPRTNNVVVFDTVAPGWSASGWQAAQQQLLARLLTLNRFARLVEQAPATHVLPQVCAALATVHRALAIQTSTATMSAKRQIALLQSSLEQVLDPQQGACQGQL